MGLIHSADRINAQVIYRFALAQVECTSNNFKQNITSLSLLVGTTIDPRMLSLKKTVICVVSRLTTILAFYLLFHSDHYIG